MEIPFEKDAVMVPVHVNETGFEKMRPPQLNKDNESPTQIASGPAEVDPQVGEMEIHMTCFTLIEDGFVNMDITETVIPSNSTDVSGNTGRAAAAAELDPRRHMMTMTARAAAATAAAPAPVAEPVPGLTRAELEFHLRYQLATCYPSDISVWNQGAMPRYCAHMFPAGSLDGSTTASSLHGNNHYHYNDGDDIDLNDVAPGHWRGPAGY